MPNFSRVLLYSFILSPGIFVQNLLAAEEGASAPSLDFVWKVVNLLILIGIIYWFARKPVSSALRNSAENASIQLEESRRMEEKSMAQMKQMRNMGSMKDILKLMPGMGQQIDSFQLQGDELKSMEAVIHSMTPAERDDPSVIDGSRRRRIAHGSGTEPQDVSGLIKSFTAAAGMMKQMAGMGMRDRMQFAQQMGQAGLAGGTPQFKKKARSKRLTKKERDKRKKRRGR